MGKTSSEDSHRATTAFLVDSPFRLNMRYSDTTNWCMESRRDKQGKPNTQRSDNVVTDASIPHGDATILLESETVRPDHNTHICAYCELRCGTTEELLYKIDTPDPREVVRVLHNSIRNRIGDQPLPLVLDPNNSPNRTPPKACEQCGVKVGSKKGLRYHMLQMHGVPLRQWNGTASKGPERGYKTKNSQETPIPSPTETASPLPQVSAQVCATTTAAPGVALLGSTLRCTFPLPHMVKCPITGCQHSFCSKVWSTSVHSAKRHSTLYHSTGARCVAGKLMRNQQAIVALGPQDQ
ncbi:hypothetical protein TNCV_3305261 [Trichonephila clavipes]|nr:hypothetical protein TNCV_3305261 [Trichonephila clavipes]